MKSQDKKNFEESANRGSPDCRNRVFLRTFGCQMNSCDSEKLIALLKKEGYEQTLNPREADYIIVNTCSVRKHAEDRAMAFIRSLKNIRGKREKVLCLAGCMANLYKEELLKEHSFLDIVCGPNHYKELPQILKEGGRVCRTGDNESPFIESGKAFAGTVSASVSITKGCENFCSYCIVPFTRGSLVSKTSSQIMEEIQDLADRGIREITLLGQNVNEYGTDTGESFTRLLEDINNIQGVERFGFLTSHPKDIPDRLVQALKHLSKLYKHLHLPVQSGSDRILQLMNRRYSAKHYMEIIDKAREAIPDINITSDIIAGFPSESDKDFCQTIDAVNKIEFDDLFVFKYSERPGTRAALMEDDVPREEKERRHREIMDLQDSISLKKNRRMEGAVTEIFVRKKSFKKPANFMGKTAANKTVMVNADNLEPGSYKKVRILRGCRHYLEGELFCGN